MISDQGTAFLLCSVIYQVLMCVNGCVYHSEPVHINYFYNDGHTDVCFFFTFTEQDTTASQFLSAPPRARALSHSNPPLLTSTNSLAGTMQTLKRGARGGRSQSICHWYRMRGLKYIRACDVWLKMFFKGKPKETNITTSNKNWLMTVLQQAARIPLKGAVFEKKDCDL